MKNHPENGVIETPGNGDGKHAAETPKADARRPASIFHSNSATDALSTLAGNILLCGAAFRIGFN